MISTTSTPRSTRWSSFSTAASRVPCGVKVPTCSSYTSAPRTSAALPAGVPPGVPGRVEHPAGPVHAGGLPGAARVGQRAAAVQAEGVVGAVPASGTSSAPHGRRAGAAHRSGAGCRRPEPGRHVRTTVDPAAFGAQTVNRCTRQTFQPCACSPPQSARRASRRCHDPRHGEGKGSTKAAKIAHEAAKTLEQVETLQRRAVEAVGPAAPTRLAEQLRAGPDRLDDVDPGRRRGSPAQGGGRPRSPSARERLSELQERLFAASQGGDAAQRAAGRPGHGHRGQGRDHAARRRLGRPAGRAASPRSRRRRRRSARTTSSGGSARRCPHRG